MTMTITIGENALCQVKRRRVKVSRKWTNKEMVRSCLFGRCIQLNPLTKSTDHDLLSHPWKWSSFTMVEAILESGSIIPRKVFAFHLKRCVTTISEINTYHSNLLLDLTYNHGCPLLVLLCQDSKIGNDRFAIECQIEKYPLVFISKGFRIRNMLGWWLSLHT
jgi:hypothetical protein